MRLQSRFPKILQHIECSNPRLGGSRRRRNLLIYLYIGKKKKNSVKNFRIYIVTYRFVLYDIEHQVTKTGDDTSLTNISIINNVR